MGDGARGKTFTFWLIKWVNIHIEKNWSYLNFRIISQITTSSHLIYTLSDVFLREGHLFNDEQKDELN